MTSSRPSADLTIPDAARDALLAFAGGNGYYESDTEAAARRVASPVVAQFLRDLASRHDRVTGGFLAELANELDGGERDE